MPEKKNATARDLRKSVRKPLPSKAIFISLNVASKAAPTIDLSEGGLSLTLDKPLELDRLCAITFDVPVGALTQRALVSGRVKSCVEQSPQAYRIGIQLVQADVTSLELIKLAVNQYLPESSNLD